MHYPYPVPLSKKYYSKNNKQEVIDDLSVCVLNLLPEVSNLTSLVVKSLVKMEIKIFQTVT